MHTILVFPSTIVCAKLVTVAYGFATVQGYYSSQIVVCIPWFLQGNYITTLLTCRLMKKPNSSLCSLLLSPFLSRYSLIMSETRALSKLIRTYILIIKVNKRITIVVASSAEFAILRFYWPQYKEIRA